MIIGNEELHEEASSSLQRIQKFDTHDLARESDLGTSLNFKDAILPAQQLVDLYSRLSIKALDDFPDAQLTVIRDHANAHFKLFSQILEFSPEQQNPHGVRTAFIDQIIAAYPTQQLFCNYIHIFLILFTGQLIFNDLILKQELHYKA